MTSADNVLVNLRGITKSFPGVQALSSVDLDITRGSCHALVGENGAGKSTLGKILAGIYTADTGTLAVDGVQLCFHCPRDAIGAGIAMVHQELLFCENLTVAENLCLGRLPRRGLMLARNQMIRDARDCLAKFDAEINPLSTLGELPISRQQVVQIAAAVARGARVLIFDEPTSSLSLRETERLFQLVRELQHDGVTVIYISHRIEEVFQVSDTITVLRDGQVVETRPAAVLDESSVVESMIGRTLDSYFPKHLDAHVGEEVLRVEGLSSPGRFEDITFSLHSGEVLGLAGLMGSGRTEIAEALFGLDPDVSGGIFLRGTPITVRHPHEAMDHGLGLIPEDRKRHGLVLSMNARQNMSLPSLGRLSRLGWIRRGKERSLAEEYIEKLQIRAPGMDAGAMGLSGGNQQKLVIARWLAARCRILLMDEPTRGVDVGAKAEIHGLIDELARTGVGILLISSELPEILNLATRIIVVRNGRRAGELARAEANQDSLLRLMAGLG